MAWIGQTRLKDLSGSDVYSSLLPAILAERHQERHNFAPFLAWFLEQLTYHQPSPISPYHM
jgi:hypothetical protein